MARTPLFPRGGDFASWALNITQRIERDYAELKNLAVVDDDLRSLSAAIVTNITSVSSAINTDIHSISAIITADFYSNDASVYAATVADNTSLYALAVADNASLYALVSSDLRSLSLVIKADINSVSAAIKTDVYSVAAGIIAGFVTDQTVFPADLRSLSADIQLNSIDPISNTVSVIAVNLNAISNTVSAIAVNLNAVSNTVSVMAVNINAISNTISAISVNLAALSNSVSLLNTLVVNPRAYGATGDGVTDDTAAILAAAAAAKGKTLYFPAGKYIMKGAITLTGGIAICGAGMDVTEIRWNSSFTSAGIYLLGTAAYHETHTVRDLTLVTEKAVSNTTRAAIAFDYTAQIVSLTGSIEIALALQTRYVVERVGITGAGAIDTYDATTDGWRYGIESIAGGNGYCSHVYVIGQAVSGVLAVAGTAGIYNHGNPSDAFNNGRPSIVQANSCKFDFLEFGVAAVNCEGVFIANCNAVACNFGYWVYSTLNAHPQVTIMGSHANSYQNAVLIQGQQQIAITGNLFYTIQTTSAGASPIYLQNVNDGAVYGNTVSALPPTTVNYGIVLDTCSYLAVSDNSILGPYVGTGIVANAATNNIKGSNNVARNVSGKAFSDGGTNNRVNERVEAGTRQANISVAGGQLVTISFSTVFDNTINSVVANPMNAGAVAAADDWVAINSYSVGGFIVRYNTSSTTGTRSIHFMAFGH